MLDHTYSGGYTVVPEDIAKWANICTEVVRHYFDDYGIRYYEIWNEPDQPAMWDGTIEQYYELYRVTAQAIQKEFGNQVKIGGPALATSTTETIGAFLKAVKGYPLDFLSVHAYRSDPEQYNSDQICSRNTAIQMRCSYLTNGISYRDGTKDLSLTATALFLRTNLGRMLPPR